MPFNILSALKKADGDFEVSDELAKAINAAVAEHEAPLKEKKDALLEEVRKHKGERDEANEAAESASERADKAASDLDTATQELDAARKKQDDPEVQERLKEIYQAKTNEAVKKIEADRDKWKESAEGLQKNDERRRITEQFDASFKKNHVIEDHRRGLRLQMMEDAKRIELDEGRALLDGVPVEDLVERFAGDDSNKLFISAPDNDGGGAPGNRNSGSEKINPWKKETTNLTLRGKITRENPALAERMKKEAGAR